MTVAVAPYLQFRDTARQAMEFYQQVLGGEATFSTLGESGMAQDPAEADKIMHSQLVKDGVAILMAADTPSSMDPPPATSSVAVSLFGGSEDAEEMHRQWDLLAEGATHVVEPLTRAPWGDEFGMVVDRFGTFWMVNIGGDQPQG
ncbi:VOC family protein [Salana multivorans]